MHQSIARLLAISLGTTIAVGSVLLLRPVLTNVYSPAIVLHDRREGMAELEEYLGSHNNVNAGASRGPLGHLLLTAPVADRVFKYTAQGMTYDPLTYFRRRPFLNTRRAWPEHPRGVWWMRTNSLGLREDREISRERPDLRVFVTGDSHTDGVCENTESFPHRLEASLRAARPSATVEILNAGVGGYSFYNYVGAFDRYLEFDMDVFVVAVYGGNDFKDIIKPYMFWQGKKAPGWDGAKGRIVAGAKIDAPSVAQFFQAYAYFAEHPGLEEIAVDESVRVSLELKRRCDQEGVGLVIAYIPPAHDVQHESRENWERLSATLQLDEYQLQVTQRQADRYLSALKEEGIATVDLRPAFLASTEPLYWVRDWHINLAGHQLVADTIRLEVVKAWGRARGARKGGK